MKSKEQTKSWVHVILFSLVLSTLAFIFSFIPFIGGIFFLLPSTILQFLSYIFPIKSKSFFYYEGGIESGFHFSGILLFLITWFIFGIILGRIYLGLKYRNQ